MPEISAPVRPAELLASLRRILGRDRVLTRTAELIAYEYDASLARSRPEYVVFPESAEEVSEILAAAGRHGAVVVGRGAGTGLSGGAIAVRGGVVVCFTRMNRIIRIDARNRLAVVEPGVVNADLSKAAEPYGLYYPPDPSSQKICTLGGNVAENSGGAHCLAHGTTTNYVVGMEVALAGGGRAWAGSELGETPGYDLAGVLVGSEGTFGLVTKIALRLRRMPEAVRTLLVSFPDIRTAGDAVSDIIARGIVPVALEMMDRVTVRAVEEALHPGFPMDAGAVLLVEVEGIEDGLDAEIGEIGAVCRSRGATGLRLAASAAEREALWAGRKGARSVLGRLRPNYYVHDGVVPRTRVADALEAIVEAAARQGLPVATYLHAGDGNIHPNILFDAADAGEARRAEEAGKEILRICVAMGGTLSGEHGIGLEKQDFLGWIYSADDMAAMRRVKAAFDPRGLFNPQKVFPKASPWQDSAPSSGGIMDSRLGGRSRTAMDGSSRR